MLSFAVSIALTLSPILFEQDPPSPEVEQAMSYGALYTCYAAASLELSRRGAGGGATTEEPERLARIRDGAFHSMATAYGHEGLDEASAGEIERGVRRRLTGVPGADFPVLIGQCVTALALKDE
jgi:hypothetical protein